jgi:hypothetical protein
MNSIAFVNDIFIIINLLLTVAHVWKKIKRIGLREHEYILKIDLSDRSQTLEYRLPINQQ